VLVAFWEAMSEAAALAEFIVAFLGMVVRFQMP